MSLRGKAERRKNILMVQKAPKTSERKRFSTKEGTETIDTKGQRLEKNLQRGPFKRISISVIKKEVKTLDGGRKEERLSGRGIYHLLGF